MDVPCVLVISPSWQIRKLIRANLEAIAIRVREAADTQRAIEILRSSSPRLILLDLEVPGADCLRQIDDISSQLSGDPAPIIVMAAEPPGRELLDHWLASAYLLKPFSVPVLMEKVHQALQS